MRGRDDHDIARGEQFEQTIGRPDRAHSLGSRPIDAAPNGQDGDAERRGQSRDLGADRAEADYAQAHAGERLNGVRAFELILRPVMRRLCADRSRQAARQRDGHADDVLRYRARPDAAGAGHDDAARDELGEHQAADADGGTLDPPQPRGGWKDVAIHERRERDVGIGQVSANRAAVPRLQNPVLGKVAPDPVDERLRDDPDRSRTDNANQNVHHLERAQGRLASRPYRDRR